MANTATHHRPFEMPTAHPMDSARLFMSLLGFVRDSEEPGAADNPQHIISVPTLRRLLSAIHFRDANTLKHSRRVGLISVGIASRLGWEQDDLRIIEIAALLHDMGKIGVPDHILRKPGKLSPDEAEYIATHHRVALAMLQACQAHPTVTEIVAESHGVDEELTQAGQGPCLGARILAVADAYDSLTTRQSYRPPYDRWEALQILEEQSGKQFDRNVVAALGRWLDSPEAAGLADERAAEVSIQVNAPVDMETRANSGQLCQILSHLYLLESLYDAFYIIDAHRRVVIWSRGAGRLFNRTAGDVLRKKWSRQLVSKTPANGDPLEMVFMTGQPLCHVMSVQDAEHRYIDVDVQSLPIHDEKGDVMGVVELVYNGKESKRNQGQFRSLQMAATRDPLTGVFNRGELERKLEECHEIWQADSGREYAVIFLDLDHFKSINDRLSHAIGDRVLIELARLLQDELYSGEFVGRYGGEEFVIVCPETPLESVVERAERLRRVIMSSQFADRDDLRVTASLGVASVQRQDSTDTIVQRADKALYEAKRQGRNRTCVGPANVMATSDDQQVRRRKEFAHQATIVTCVAADMLTLKLAGFVEDYEAKILNVNTSQVVLQVGSSSLFGGWSKNGARAPVRVTMDVDTPQLQGAVQRIPKLALNILVEPIGRPTSHEIFSARAGHIVEQLRSCLLAD